MIKPIIPAGLRVLDVLREMLLTIATSIAIRAPVSKKRELTCTEN